MESIYKYISCKRYSLHVNININVNPVKTVWKLVYKSIRGKGGPLYIPKPHWYETPLVRSTISPKPQ